ncbi:MAG TPA: hypothetical protein VMR02_18970 [Terracidiphilus sp.]|jgi:hypothetical protein|nr:hypothetical protein [Terracidiphilus sp.]
MAGHEERVQIAAQLTLEPRDRRPASALAMVPKPTPLTGNEAATGAASLPVIGSVLKIASHEIPETTVPASVVALETEPLNSLYLRALSTANPARQKVLVTAGSDRTEPANPLPMATTSKLETRPDTALPALALAAACRGWSASCLYPHIWSSFDGPRRFLRCRSCHPDRARSDAGCRKVSQVRNPSGRKYLRWRGTRHCAAGGSTAGAAIIRQELAKLSAGGVYRGEQFGI